MKENRKYGSYQPLRKALEKSGIKSSGKTATLLLEMFLERDGKIYAAEVYKRGLSRVGEFVDWRKNLIEKGWIVFTLENNKYSRYVAGPKLVTYLNREIKESKQIASAEQVNRVDDKIELLESKLAEQDSKLAEQDSKLADLDRAVRNLIEKFDPPYDEDKKEKYLNVVK